MSNTLKQILDKIRPFNIKLTRAITKVDDICINKIKDQDIVLFFGGTGSGKSTTIQYLTGCEMQKVEVPNKDGNGHLTHIEAKSFP